jgi:hypothetical protein
MCVFPCTNAVCAVARYLPIVLLMCAVPETKHSLPPSQPWRERGSFEAYIESIEDEIEEYGIGRIVPPEGWAPRQGLGHLAPQSLLILYHCTHTRLHWPRPRREHVHAFTLMLDSTACS